MSQVLGTNGAAAGTLQPCRESVFCVSGGHVALGLVDKGGLLFVCRLFYFAYNNIYGRVERCVGKLSSARRCA